MTIFESYAEHFERTMRDIAISEDDIEDRHRRMDEVMCETLEEFGCHEGVKIFRETNKWYA
jgi:hypothetical protein